MLGVAIAEVNFARNGIDRLCTSGGFSQKRTKDRQKGRSTY